jgi:hypothetical protein
MDTKNNLGWTCMDVSYSDEVLEYLKGTLYFILIKDCESAIQEQRPIQMKEVGPKLGR